MARSKNQTVLVTGASSGIGYATALYLAEKGYLVIGSSRSIERLSGLKDEARKSGVELTAIELDINSDEGVDAVLPSLIEERGPIDALVNNAGFNMWGPVESLSTAELKAQFETNFFAQIRLIRAVLPGMVKQGHGTVVNVSSVLGRIGTPFNGAYASSKFALEGLSESLQVELRPLGVRVALVEPGLYRTDLMKNQVIAERADAADLPYRGYVEKYRSRHRRFDWFMGDPIAVAKVIHKVILSRRPRFRYQVGVEAWLGVAAARLMPERLYRALLARATM